MLCKKTFCFISIITASLNYTFAQSLPLESKSYPKDYFAEPLKLPPQASGSFGELRSNHFHTGTDYRTNQREGYPVYAVADGFVSRIRVQIGGGGNALYLQHPNGFTSVYMHLRNYNERIAPVAKALQYEKKSFSLDENLKKDQIPVKKGEIIAYSGNTGGSAGPHLHFELRDSKTEDPINAQLFGLTIPDRVPPLLSGMTLYHLGDEPFDEHTPRQHFSLTGSNGNYQLSGKQPLAVNGAFGMGIVAVDQTSVSPNRNGVYSIELLLDGVPHFTAVFETLSFAESRAINSLIDYPYYILHSRRIQKSFVEPGNKLEIYRNLVNKGIIELNDEEVHRLLYRIKDIQGNVSTLSFSVQNTPSLNMPAERPQATASFRQASDNRFEKEDIEINLPKGALYSDLAFVYSKGSRPQKGYSSVHQVHNRMIPLHLPYSLKIKADANFPKHLEEKALILNQLGGSAGGTFQNGFVETSTSLFGGFYIGVDTIAPVIRPVNIGPGKNMAALDRINFKISDDLSGIRSFDAYIDDEWVLMEFDAKTASLWHVFETDLPKGKHSFRLVVKDMKNNEKRYSTSFVR